MTDYGIKRFHAYSVDELVNALRTYSRERNVRHVSARAFAQVFGVSTTTLENKLGSWRELCARAGIAPRYDRTANRASLLTNLDRVWSELGRQPRAKEMKQPLSPISVSRYQKVFGKPWYNICVDFLAWRTGLSPEEIEDQARAVSDDPPKEKKRTPRNVSLSLRYDVLKRDSFRCTACGRSPASESGVKLHIDHIHPWSRDGETEIDNLQTLCGDCNQGKSDKTAQPEGPGYGSQARRT